MTGITSWAGTPGWGVHAAFFAYQYNATNQRTRMDVGGASSASPDYGLYTYDALGQVISGKRYWSDGTPVAGQQFEYGFDDIGNRKVARRGGDENGWNLRQSIYTANLLNQYTQRTVPGFVDIIGIALATNPVYVNGQMASRKGEYFRRELSVNNAGAPVWLGVTVTSPGGPTVTGNLFVPRTPEAFTHDLDGNLTSDGRWNYWWDGENRLVRVQSRSDTPQGSWRRVEWQYDALGRRIRQTTWNWLVQSNLWVVTEDLKFVSDPLLYGRHVVDLNASNNVPVRTYVWGLDLSETMDGAGGVGGLLWLTLHTASGSAAGTHFCTYDGNGNVVVLVNASDGSVTARYEYGPFAEPIRLTGPAATLNPFRFSTKRTCNTTDLVLYEYRVYNPILGRWPCRDPVDESGSKLLRGERPKYRVDRELIGQTRLDEEKNLYRSVLNDPISRYDYLGLGHNFGRCCNESGGVEWALLDGRWRMLNPGECTGIFEDCDGMTCGGGFYYVLAFEWAACITPGCDSPPFTNRRWQPDGGGDPGGKPPSGEGGRGSLEGDVPPGYKYGPRPPCSCKNPRPGAVHNR